MILRLENDPLKLLCGKGIAIYSAWGKDHNLGGGPFQIEQLLFPKMMKNTMDLDDVAALFI